MHERAWKLYQSPKWNKKHRCLHHSPPIAEYGLARVLQPPNQIFTAESYSKERKALRKARQIEKSSKSLAKQLKQVRKRLKECQRGVAAMHRLKQQSSVEVVRIASLDAKVNNSRVSSLCSNSKRQVGKFTRITEKSSALVEEAQVFSTSMNSSAESPQKQKTSHNQSKATPLEYSEDQELLSRYLPSPTMKQTSQYMPSSLLTANIDEEREYKKSILQREKR